MLRIRAPGCSTNDLEEIVSAIVAAELLPLQRRVDHPRTPGTRRWISETDSDWEYENIQPLFYYTIFLLNFYFHFLNLFIYFLNMQRSKKCGVLVTRITRLADTRSRVKNRGVGNKQNLLATRICGYGRMEEWLNMDNRIAVGYLQTELSCAKTKCQESPPNGSSKWLEFLRRRQVKFQNGEKTIIFLHICAPPSFHLFAPVRAFICPYQPDIVMLCVTNHLEWRLKPSPVARPLDACVGCQQSSCRTAGGMMGAGSLRVAGWQSPP